MAAWTLRDIASLPKRLWARLFGARIPAQCARIYFESAQSEYQSQRGLPGSREDPAAEESVKAIVAKYEAGPNSLTMNDALLYERLVSRLLPIESLRRKVMNVRGKYRRMVSPEDFQGYLDGGPPNPLVAPAAEVLADLDDLLGRVQWVYIIDPFRESMRSRISIRVVLALLVLILAVVFLMWMRYQAPGRPSGIAEGAGIVIPSLLVSMVLGAIGGLVSVEQRIQSAPTDGDAIRNVMSLYNGMFSIYLSPVMGAISAGLLYTLIVGGFLQGSLFPKLVTNPDGHSLLDLESFLEASGPGGGADYAKLAIWSFIAGFAERFVPDTLSRLVGTVGSPASGPPRPVAEPAPRTATDGGPGHS